VPTQKKHGEEPYQPEHFLRKMNRSKEKVILGRIYEI
jgi:hypothetical protein